MSDRIAVMGNGHIEQVGNRTEIFDKANLKLCSSFLGINTFDGKAIKICKGYFGD